jgi:uncharacterized membrane protein YhaH (DUF805 family)
MNFIEAITSGFKNYVNFRTRAARSEYWYWTLFVVLLTIATSLIDLAIIPRGDFGPLTTIATLALLLPGLAVSVRRLHDRDQSGWWLLLFLVPLIGPIVLLVWFCMRGSVGANRFGPDPLEGKV